MLLLLVTVNPTPIPPLWSPASASTRRQSRPAPLFSSHGRLEASRAVLILLPPSSELGRARASRTERNRRRSSLRPTLAAPPQSVALRAARPRPEAPPSIHERGRALPRPKSSPRRRPPLLSSSSFAPSSAPHVELHLPAILRFKLNRGEHPYDLLSLTGLLPTQIRGRRRRIAAAPPWNAPPTPHARRPPSLRQLAGRRCAP